MGGDDVPTFDAVLLAGGRAHRLGGLHKPGLDVGGRPVLHRVAEAVSAARRLVVVGPVEGAPPAAIVVREDPPASGPIPALRAGLPQVTASWTILLAGDLPFVRRVDVTDLLHEAARGFGAVVVDDGGSEQWLFGAWQSATLRTAVASYDGRSLRGLLRPLSPVRLVPAVPADTPPPWLDCDTMGDLEIARGWTCRP